MSNLATQPKKFPFSAVINTELYKKSINNALQDPERSKRFIAAITSAVTATPALQECDPKTIINAALLGEALNLSPSPQLGQFYMVPFEVSMKGADGKTLYETDENGERRPVKVKQAQFVLGYKGYIQLALRSGNYKRLNAMPVKEGELISYDPLTEEIVLRMIDDEDERYAAKTIGYVAMFEYTNGFRKTIYWSKKKMVSHADKFSPAFSKNAVKTKRFTKVSFEDYEAGKFDQRDTWLYSSFWYKDFDSMALKTLLRHLISKWGIMSIDLQKAFEADVQAETEEQNHADVVIEDDPVVSQQPEEEPEELSMDDL